MRKIPERYKSYCSIEFGDCTSNAIKKYITKHSKDFTVVKGCVEGNTTTYVLSNVLVYEHKKDNIVMEYESKSEQADIKDLRQSVVYRLPEGTENFVVCQLIKTV